jgi:hypothetical protein
LNIEGIKKQQKPQHIVLKQIKNKTGEAKTDKKV